MVRGENMIEEDFKFFLESLRRAMGRMNDPHYFQLSVATEDGGKKIFRERVYCYELYHQLRCVLGNWFPYKLDGEVDKAGHPIIRKRKIPDLIVHKPGEMNLNLVVIEVKPISVRAHQQELEKDLETLQYFLGEEGKYYYAVMLVYGDGKQNLHETIRSKVASFSRNCGNRILLVWHGGCKQEPEILCFE